MPETEYADIFPVLTNPCITLQPLGSNPNTTLHFTSIKEKIPFFLPLKHLFSGLWGENLGGKLGDGTNIGKNIPIQAGTVSDGGCAYAAYGFSFGIITNNPLWAWGSGQLGDGNNMQQNAALQITLCGRLPLRLVASIPQQHDHTFLPNWQATNEINTRHFILRRSAKGKTSNNIGSAEAKTTSGNTKYSLTDASLAGGVNFCRLYMAHIDGKTTNSPIIKIVFESKDELQVFPNPATNTNSLSGLQNKSTIKIIAVAGKLAKQMSAGGYSMLIDIKHTH